MGGEKSAPAREPIFVDFLAVAQLAHQPGIDVEGRTAGQAEPADLLWPVKPPKNRAVERLDWSARRFYWHCVTDRAQ